jgi:hypothetical protein
MCMDPHVYDSIFFLLIDAMLINLFFLLSISFLFFFFMVCLIVCLFFIINLTINYRTEQCQNLGISRRRHEHV